MPILLQVLDSSDQKVVEQGSICVSRVVESFKYQQDKLEELVSTDLLKAIRRLLQPGTTNLIGPNIHTQFLRVLSITAHASPRLSAELLKMSIVDTLYQILTGLSPPSGRDVASQIDSVFIMQALIHRPREQISETLNVICELLPAVQVEKLSFQENPLDMDYGGDGTILQSEAQKRSPNSKRLELLQGCRDELKRFAIILFPTLTDAYSSTVNLGVRQKVLTAQLKMLSNLDTSILEDALRSVPYASYLASILSQEDHPSLVTAALKAADLLLNRLMKIYGYQFYREGVMAEVFKLANKPLTKVEKPKSLKADPDDQMANVEIEGSNSTLEHPGDKGTGADPADDAIDPNVDDEEEDGDDDDDDDDGDVDEDDVDVDVDDDGPREIRDDMSPSPTESSSTDQDYPMRPHASEQDINILRAKRFLEAHETTKGTDMRNKAAKILRELQALATSIRDCYLGDGDKDGKKLFTKLSAYFGGDALDTITSSELLHSNIVDVFLEVFGSSEGKCAVEKL